MNCILEVNVDSVLNNLKVIEDKNNNKKVCIPIKGNAYGIGYGILDFLIAKGYNFFGVSTLEEAIYVRSLNNDVDILLFSSIFKEDLEVVRRENIIITVYDFEILNLLEQDIKFHLKFDAGMGRLGFFSKDIVEIINILKDKNLVPSGIYTHLPEANNSESSLEQIQNFEEIVSHFSSFNIEYIHYANGLASLKYNTSFDNMVRPGLAVYGYLENLSIKKVVGKNIQSSIKLKVRVGHVKEYNGSIGYDGVEGVSGTVVTLPIGYHDGLKQSYRGYNIAGVGKIVGKICMCQTMVLLNDNVNISKGDYINVLNLGDIYELSDYSKVSVYEILSVLGNRIERKYIKNNR